MGGRAATKSEAKFARPAQQIRMSKSETKPNANEQMLPGKQEIAG
jgi:hypothetical protein